MLMPMRRETQRMGIDWQKELYLMAHSDEKDKEE